MYFYKRERKTSRRRKIFNQFESFQFVFAFQRGMHDDFQLSDLLIEKELLNGKIFLSLKYERKLNLLLKIELLSLNFNFFQ